MPWYTCMQCMGLSQPSQAQWNESEYRFEMLMKRAFRRVMLKENPMVLWFDTSWNFAWSDVECPWIWCHNFQQESAVEIQLVTFWSLKDGTNLLKRQFLSKINFHPIYVGSKANSIDCLCIAPGPHSPFLSHWQRKISWFSCDFDLTPFIQYGPAPL